MNASIIGNSEPQQHPIPQQSHLRYISPSKHQQQPSFKNNVPGTLTSINTGQDPITRRVWVRKSDANPTSLYVKSSHVVDDLKMMIMEKFPTSLAKQCDPSDLSIKAEIGRIVSVSPNSMNSPMSNHDTVNAIKSTLNDLNLHKQVQIQSQSQVQPQLHLNLNSPISQNFAPISPIPLSATTSSLLLPRPPSINDNSVFHGKINSPATVILEPDRNVWNILDSFYPNGMSIENAFIIEAPHVLNNYNSFNQSSNNGSTLENSRQNYQRRSLSLETMHESQEGNTNRRLHSESSQSHSGRRSATPNYHRRSQSNPAEHQFSILLLPSSDSNDSNSNSNNKNFINKTEISPLIESPENEFPKSNGSLETLKPTNSNQSNKSLKKPQPNKITNGTSAMAKVLPSVNVLVVEDNQINLRILSAHLRRHRIKHDTAKNGQEAIDKWRKGGFHLVLMDIQLPVLSGLDASKEIRRLERINNIGVFASANAEYNQQEEIKPGDTLDLKFFRSPVIIVALTASNLNQDKQEALAAGCNDYLTKPVNFEWLLNKITEWGCMQALIDFDGWKSGERISNISAAIPSLVGNKPSKKPISNHSGH
ncbi:hypothetical protein WICMUC_005176 [Wickerhamomyces mucosus]|uniref:Response regulatory domain-containing protein n=1 Tax=Wickerhamomyces mucosus TaxID=1378264 RepID=A0A9P8P8W0_9ASCO|nr:hypothetical protein WICMUC_005176 [Wickerhamomyces mucosus]